MKNIYCFHDIIADMLNNSNLNPIVTELFNRGRKLNISLVFITQSYFAALKNIRIISTQYFIMKIVTKWEQSFIRYHYKKCTAKPYAFLVIDTTLASDNPLRFRKKSVRKNVKTNHNN